MADRIITNSERGMTVTVNNIEHIESQSVNGVGVIKIFFQPDANIQTALAQVHGDRADHGARRCRRAPRRRWSSATPRPPRRSCSSASAARRCPTRCCSISGQNFLRNQLATVQGAATPYPYGGKIRQVQVDLDMPRLRAAWPVAQRHRQRHQRAERDHAVGHRQNRAAGIPGGDEQRAAQPIAELNDLPVKTVNGATIYMRDVAHVRDGFSPQTNIVRQDGVHGVLMSMYKIGTAPRSTIVKAREGVVPVALQSLPQGITVKPLFDQSLFVRASINGVLREGPDRRRP